ncbi:putative Cytochrome P450, family 81, subfamily K, polypeptide 2 [Hibiscus syriacus]|uniref:Cytochrome P450, family 81, subfamily K, polypeptide 2 n=1 Tax=Hibiscus syriacus TaxID=106335 RepID=A0A6A3CET8_HIBSY|nr:putative Cytochrome P450, family 81, subfamily K, polypeptide 2 [Hibiscus syriacus]
MLSQPALQLRLLQTLMVVMLLSLLVSADQKDDEPLLVGINARPPFPQEKQRLRHSFGVFFSSKRKVPNAADPLHNR